GRCRRRFVLLVLSDGFKKQGVTDSPRQLRPIDKRAPWGDKSRRADRITGIARKGLHMEVVDPAITHGVHVHLFGAQGAFEGTYEADAQLKERRGLAVV